MVLLLHSWPMLAPKRSALPGSGLVSPRRYAARHPCAALLPGPSLAPGTSAALFAGCHARARAASPRQHALDLQSCPPPPLPGRDSRPHTRVALPPTPDMRPASPAHTRGSSPASRDGTPPPLALFVAVSSCHRGK